MIGLFRSIYWAHLRPNDLTPQLQALLRDVREHARCLAGGYLTAWELLQDLERRVEFLRHTQCRTIFGHDDPDVRRALVASGSIIASRLCVEVATHPDRKIRQWAERMRALFHDLLNGKRVEINESGINVVVHLDINEGKREINLPKLPRIDDAAWEVHLDGPPPQTDYAGDPNRCYASISGAMWLGLTDEALQVLANKMTLEAWMERWNTLWHRNLFHVLLEPGMSAHLRQTLANITYNMMAHQYMLLKAKLGEPPMDTTMNTWAAVLQHISHGGLARTFLVGPSLRLLGSMHFDLGERFGGCPNSALDESILATFTRVSECDLAQLDTRIRKHVTKVPVRRLLH